MPAPSRRALSYYARNFASEASVAVRKAVGRDQRHRIGRYDATLPASHLLPRLQQFFPEYDVYAARVLRDLCHGSTNPLLIDIGANVGDTALLALDAIDHLRCSVSSLSSWRPASGRISPSRPTGPPAAS